MNQETETLLPEPERTPAAYRRDLHRARLVVGQLRDEAPAESPSRLRTWPWTPLPSMSSGTGWIGWTPTSGKTRASAATWSQGGGAGVLPPERPWWKFWGGG